MGCSIRYWPVSPRGRRLARIGVSLLATIMIFAGCADRLILMPPPGVPSSIPGAERRQIPFGQTHLEAWTTHSGPRDARPRAIVLEFTGNAAAAEDMIDYAGWRWGGAPIEAWVVNYPGYGNSPGPARLSSLGPAGLAAYDAAAEHAAGRPVIVCGVSIGTAVALHVAANRPASGLLLYNPPALRSLILRRYGWWNLWLGAIPVAMRIPGSLDSIANAANASAPAVLVSSSEDRVVPPWNQQRVIDAYAGPKRIVRLPGAGHNDLPFSEGEQAAVAEAMRWLLDQVAPASPSTPP